MEFAERSGASIPQGRVNNFWKKGGFTPLNTAKGNLTGFTLIELLVVISIIGFLATASMVMFNNARMKAKNTRCKADLKQILTAIDLKRDEYNKVLLGVTGSGCSDCSCRPFDEATLNSSACINRMTTTFRNLGFSGALRDPWGVFYMIDENEGEGGGCGRDSLRSLNCGSVLVPFYICK